MRYKVGNLVTAFLEGEVQVIAHQCNCFNAMGAGVAKEIAERLPAVQRVDSATKSGDKRKLGHFTIASDISTGGFVFNLYGQFATSSKSRATDYEHLRSALRGMSFIVKKSHKIGLPKIGAGFGGGDWNTIVQIIEEELSDFYVTIYVLKESDIPQ